jgi:hypothetical protein
MANISETKRVYHIADVPVLFHHEAEMMGWKVN